MAFLQANLNKIQRIQNTLARVVTNTSKFEDMYYTNTQTNYIGFQSNNASITKFVFLHIKSFKFSNLPIFTIVFLFLLTLCLQDHLIHRFCPFHMSEHLWVKGPFLSLLQDSGSPSHLTPVTRSLSVSTFRSKLKTHLFNLAFPLAVAGREGARAPPTDCPGPPMRFMQIRRLFWGGRGVEGGGGVDV